MKKRFYAVILGIVLVLLAGCGDRSWSSGDRVLVAKFMYDSGVQKPGRHDVVVFRYPREPLKNGVPTNYIKRLIGLMGETLAIFFGQLFETTDLTYPEDEKVNPLELWHEQYMHSNDARAKNLFRQGKFKIIRKAPDTMLALRRIVFDNDKPARDLQGVLPPRWAGVENSAWTADAGNGFQHAGKAQSVDWLRYRHILRPDDWPAGKSRTHKPQLITDFSGYNSYELSGVRRAPAPNWVGDLMLECNLTVERTDGEVWLELARGVDRFQARWELQTGKCTLVRLQDNAKVAEQTLDSAMTRVNKPGSYQLRFANFSQRLTVWVDRDLPFGEGVNYEHAWTWDENKGFVNTGPTANDLKPASVGSKGAGVQVQHLILWRDTYYTSDPSDGRSDAQLPSPVPPDEFRDSPEKRAEFLAEFWANFWGSPEQWANLRSLEPRTMYVQPGHYLCLGDNSPESSDSRTWGLVPERLLLGRALVVYYPFDRGGVIH